MIPAGANNLLVYTKSGSYEMATGTAGLIKDGKRLYGATVTAISNWTGQTPAMAYDNDTATQWQTNGGGDSWIEFNLLGSSVALNRVRLLNNFNNGVGPTVTVTVLAGATANPSTTAHTFIQSNADGQWFDATFTAVTGTNYVRFNTSTTGASWTKYKEIELYEE